MVTLCENSAGCQWKSGVEHLALGDRGLALFWSERSTVGHAVSRPGDGIFDLIKNQRKGEMILPCQLVGGGKFRNGADRQWCTTHQCAYGTIADHKRGKCGSADIPVSVQYAPPVLSGELSVWYATKPAIVLGDRRRKFAEGIHVHQWRNGVKKIDATFPAIVVSYAGSQYAITPTIARSRLAALLAGVEQQDAVCPKCQHLHNDLGYFAENLHRMHLCGKCGGTFYTSEKNTCNSIASLPRSPQGKETQGVLRITSAEFSAIAIWATTPALFALRPQTQDGIHVHAWQGKEKVLDGSYSSVFLNEQRLDRQELLEAMLGSPQWEKKDLYRQAIVH